MLVTFLALALSASPVPRCSLEWTPRAPGPDFGVILAVATGMPVEVPVPEDPTYKRSLPTQVRSVTAYRFRVMSVAGGRSGLEAGDSFLAVPWGYDTGCAPQVWDGSTWVPTGAEGVFEFETTRAGPSGERILDVLGWHAPYPQGELLRFAVPTGTPGNPRTGSVRQYSSLLDRMPKAAGSDTAQPTLAMLEHVLANGDPAWTTRFPGTLIIDLARRAAGGGPPSN